MKNFNSKILLFGEYSLLYGSMGLTMPYSPYSGTWAFSTDKNDAGANYSNECLKSFATFVSNYNDENFEFNTEDFVKDIENGLYFQSNIPHGSGLGSSGAIVAAVFVNYIKDKVQLEEMLNNLNAKNIQLLRLTLSNLESFFHSSSSGIDPLSILMNKPLLYKRSNDISPTEIPAFDKNGKNSIFLLNTELERNTEGLVAQFKESCHDRTFRQEMEKELITHSDESINCFLAGNTKKLYNHLKHIIEYQLDKMNCLIPTKFQSLVKEGIETGEYFLKICGAGGGGFILGFTENWEQTKEKLNDYKLELIYNY